MEVLMPELVGLVLCHVEDVGLVAARFVCTTWKLASPPSRAKQQDYADQVAANGWLGVLRWARANGCPWSVSTCAYAAEGGHLDVLQWARANDCPWDAWTCAHAAKGGHLDVLQWARANGCLWDQWTCACAARWRHLEVLQWARANGCPE